MAKKVAVFPASFAWGAASSAAQSEGWMENTDWRIRERSGLAPESGRASDKRHRFEEDFMKLAEIGITHFRTSIEWSRIEPQKGVYNREAIESYRIMMEAAQRRGIVLWVTLHHVSLPAWFARLGGFLDGAAIMCWHRFVELVAKELGRSADFWMPISAPTAYAAGAYLMGLYPPGKTSMHKFQEMVTNIHQAHGDAYRILKAYLPAKARVGMNMLVVPVEPADPESDQDRGSADFLDCFVNRIPLDAVSRGTISVPGRGVVELPSCKGAADFLGIDYFFRLVVGQDGPASGKDCFASLAEMEGMPGLRTFRSGEGVTEQGFGARPEGVYQAIKRVHQAGLNLPMYITASGIATSDEDFRARYIARCLEQVRGAVESGLDVRGYFHWSDIDAYEWNSGYQAHYGLFGFDKESLERTARPAADLFAGITRGGPIPPELLAEEEHGPGREGG